MLLLIVFAALAVASLGQEEYGDYGDRDHSDYRDYGDRGAEYDYGDRGAEYDYGDRGDGKDNGGYSGDGDDWDSDYDRYEDEWSSMPQMMKWLDVGYRDLGEVVETRKEDHDSEHTHTWAEDVLEAAREKVLPEMCNLTADTCNLYNSFLLDCHCVEVFDKMSEQCRGLKCDLTQHLMDHGPRAFYDFLHAESIREAVEVVHRELKLVFSSHNFCKCGKELVKSFLKCARYYHGNGLMSAMACHDFYEMQTYLRNVDLEALGHVWDKLIGGMCEKANRKGDDMCLDAVFEGLKEVAGMVGGTIEDFSQWDDGSDKEKRKLEGRCDRLFGPIQAFIDAGDDEIEYYNATDRAFWSTTLNSTSAFMNNLYCKWPCKKDRSSLYPCCLKRMLNDDSLYANLERFLTSIVKLPVVGKSMWDGFGEIDKWIRQPVEQAMKFKMPEDIIDQFKRTVNAGNHCKNRSLRCSN